VIASVYLVGANTRRVRRALAALFGSAVDKDVVSRTWRKVKSHWDAWSDRPRANEPIMRLILDGRVVRVRLDEKRLHDQRHRTPTRRIQTTHQAAGRAAFGRHGCLVFPHQLNVEAHDIEHTHRADEINRDHLGMDQHCHLRCIRRNFHHRTPLITGGFVVGCS